MPACATIPAHEYVLSTKIGRWLKASQDPDYDGTPWLGGTPFEVVFDYTYDGIMRAYEQSQLRLGLARYDLAVIHDLDHMYHGTGVKYEGFLTQLATSGWRAVTELKASGLIRGVGAGVNELGMIPRFLDIVDLDFFLVAMPYTLLRQEVLDAEFPACVERGIGFVIGAPYQSGILATGPREGANADYGAPSAEVNATVGRIQAVCERHGVPLAAAALQFPLGHPSVAAVIPGARSAAQVQRNVEVFRHDIPAGAVGGAQARGPAAAGRAGPGVNRREPGAPSVVFARAVASGRGRDPDRPARGIRPGGAAVRRCERAATDRDARPGPGGDRRHPGRGRSDRSAAGGGRPGERPRPGRSRRPAGRRTGRPGTGHRASPAGGGGGGMCRRGGRVRAVHGSSGPWATCTCTTPRDIWTRTPSTSRGELSFVHMRKPIGGAP